MDPTQFIAALNRGKPAPAYFLCGPDRFLHEACRSAIVAVLPAGAREWCFAEIEFKSGRLARELEGASQMPMLGGHSYFFFSDPEDFKQLTLRKPPTCMLIFTPGPLAFLELAPPLIT